MANGIIFLDEEPATAPAVAAPQSTYDAGQRRGTSGQLRRMAYVPQGPDGVATMEDAGNVIRKGVRAIERPATVALDNAAAGFTGGLSVYADAIGTKQPGESLAQALARVRARRSADAQEYPTLAPVSQAVGQVGLGLALPASIPYQVAGQTALGAVSEYTRAPETTLGDAAKVGTIQGSVTAATGGLGSMVSGGVNALKNRIVNQFAEDFGVTTTEAAKAVATNAGQQGTWDVLKGGVGDLWNLGKSSILPIAGTSAGAYVGGELAPLAGFDPKTGRWLGGAIGGGATLAGLKGKALGQAVSGAADTAGMATTVYPNVTKALTSNTPIPAVVGATVGTAEENARKKQSQPSTSGIIFLD